MSNVYELPTATIISAIKQIPEDRWEVFCSELLTYMRQHKGVMDTMDWFRDNGFEVPEEPTMFKWVDDGVDECRVIVKVVEE